jgi:hypothetical protein
MLHLLPMCIVWHIKPILKYKPFQTYLWFFTWKNIYQWLYDYFNHLPKRHLEFTKLVKFMEFKGNIIFLNIKSRWIFMINFVKCCICLNITFFFMKMALDAPTIPSTKSNLYLLTNVETLLGLNVVMYLLEAIHSLIKFTQLKDVFVCDFITTMKICEENVYHMFYDR